MDCLFCVEDSTRFKSVYKYPFHEAIYGESSEHFYTIQTAIFCFRKTSDPTLTVEFKSTNVVMGKWTNTLSSPPKKKKLDIGNAPKPGTSRLKQIASDKYMSLHIVKTTRNTHSLSAEQKKGSKHRYVDLWQRNETKMCEVMNGGCRLYNCIYLRSRPILSPTQATRWEEERESE